MKTTVILAAAAMVAVSVSARAQITVIDPAALIKDAYIVANTAQTVQNGYKEVSGIIHGNGFGIGSLVPGLSSGVSANPLGADAATATALMSGSGTGGGMSGLFARFSGQTMPFAPTGSDPEAQMLTQRAQSAAGQMAVAQQFMNGSSTRLSLLPQLANALTGTADVKDAVDANTRVNAEQMTETAQSSQIQALAIYQQAEANAQRSREELAWRQGSEALAANAQTAANAAGTGRVSLVNN